MNERIKIKTRLEWKARLEWKLPDLWIGVFWKGPSEDWSKSGREDFDIWICLLPCVPIHIYRRRYPVSTKEVA